jgi:ABC-2 type transport system permease protein
MTFLAAVNAERIKLQTTRSPLWLVLTVVVLGLGMAGIQAYALPYGSLPPERAALGIGVFGVPVLMILSALTVTGEYRTGMIRSTFLATPRRSVVIAAKSLVVALLCGVLTAITTVGAIALAGTLVADRQRAQLMLDSFGVWREVGAMTLYAVLGAVLAVGLGVLLRHTAAVVALLLLLPFVVEPLLGIIPEVGQRVGSLLPFANAYAFTRIEWLQTVSMWWGPVGAALYFAAVVAVVFGAAHVVVGRREP